jgi:muconolactone delta-isomerase
MKILALEKEVPGVREDQFSEEILQAEAAKAWDLYQSGVLREFYFTADTHAAVLLLECDSADSARSHLARLPLVQAGLIDFDVKALAPYPGFARLFR